MDFDTLVEQEYLESDRDPSDKSRVCTGTVRISTEVTMEDQIDKNNYVINYITIFEKRDNFLNNNPLFYK